MSSRWWLWCACFIVIAGLLSYWSHQSTKITRAAEAESQQSSANSLESMQNYLAKQKDGRKLISLLKRLPQTDNAFRKIIVLRAFELNPESRDIALLASFYSDEAKQQLKKIDPLYSK